MKRKEFRRHSSETDQVLFALADPLRRGILDRLDTVVALSMAELRREISMSRQGLRKHLGVLMKAGLAERARIERGAVYFMDPEPLRRVLDDLWCRYEPDHRSVLIDGEEL
jgi:DNA-binding transcriptional ArsR family regulator